MYLTGYLDSSGPEGGKMKGKNKKKANTEKVTKIERQQKYTKMEKMEKIPIPAIRAFHRPPYSGTNIAQKGK